MKMIIFFLLLGFVWQSSNASGIGTYDDLVACLIENGFTNSTFDVERIYAIGDPQQADKLKDVSKAKMANLVACLYHKLYPDINVYNGLRQLMDRDDKVTIGQIRRMEDTAYACISKAAGNDAKFLNCVNIIDPPFDHLFATIRDVRQALHWCFKRCRLLITEMYTMQRNIDMPFEEYVKYIPNEKLTCFMACKAEEDAMNNPDRTLQKGLTQLINMSKNIDENTKEEMLKTLNKCSIQVSGVEDELHELLKCINLFKPPFLDLF